MESNCGLAERKFVFRGALSGRLLRCVGLRLARTGCRRERRSSLGAVVRRWLRASLAPALQHQEGSGSDDRDRHTICLHGAESCTPSRPNKVEIATQPLARVSLAHSSWQSAPLRHASDTHPGGLAQAGSREARFARADLVFTGGQSLYEAKRKLHPAVFAFRSSVESAHYAQARAEQPDPADQASIACPRLGFFGVLDERMDLALLAKLAEDRPNHQIVPIGPVVKISGVFSNQITRSLSTRDWQRRLGEFRD